MRIVKDKTKYTLLDRCNNVLLERYNITDFNMAILCNFNINDIVNYEEFNQYYMNT